MDLMLFLHLMNYDGSSSWELLLKAVFKNDMQFIDAVNVDNHEQRNSSNVVLLTLILNV